ncbi:MAG: PH domain-containing protein [Planctomycetota bacterium]
MLTDTHEEILDMSRTDPENLPPLAETPSDLPLNDGEQTLYCDHPSMFRNQPLGFIVLSLLCLVVVGIPFMIAWWVKCRSTELTITTQRTRLHRGWLSRNITEVWHRDIRNVLLQQSFSQRIFDTGRIGISSAGQSGIEIDVAGMKNPLLIKDLIDEHRAKVSGNE